MPELPSPAVLSADIIFGIIGIALWRYGRKKELPKVWGIGLALMVYPYFVSGPLLTWGIGVLLCFGMLWLR